MRKVDTSGRLTMLYSPFLGESMDESKTKIDLIDDAEATGDVARVYDEWRAKSGRQKVPGILRCFSHRPDFLREVLRFGDTVHFSEGHLSRRHKEAIASWVSYLNRCPY
jgi:alkylhydroperoxidase family enzyme